MLVSALAILYGQRNIVRTMDSRGTAAQYMLSRRGGFYTILLPHILLSFTILLILHFLLISCRAFAISTPDLLPKYSKQAGSPGTHGPTNIREIPAIVSHVADICSQPQRSTKSTQLLTPLANTWDAQDDAGGVWIFERHLSEISLPHSRTHHSKPIWANWDARFQDLWIWRHLKPKFLMACQANPLAITKTKFDNRGKASSPPFISDHHMPSPWNKENVLLYQLKLFCGTNKVLICQRQLDKQTFSIIIMAQ